MHFIKFNEQELPLTIDFSVVKNACSKLDVKLSGFESVIENPDQTLVVFGEALKRGHKLEGKPFEKTDEEIENILSSDGVYGSFLKAFGECVLKMFAAPDAKKK